MGDYNRQTVIYTGKKDYSIIPTGSLSFSGTDVHGTCFISPELSDIVPGSVKSFKRFAELQTITISSMRGVAPVRALGEHWVRDYVRGTRTFAGTLVFAVLEKDVFGDFYQLDKRDTPTPYTAFVDQLPPFTIGLNAISENGNQASMFLHGVTITNWGMALSVDDLFVETTYNYVAKWVTPFIPGNLTNSLDKLKQLVAEPYVKRASELYTPRKPVGF